MKRTIISFLLLFLALTSFSQSKADSVKTGWVPGYLPAIAFDSDLGIYYGLILNPFDYGDGSLYPNYRQSLLFQVAGYSRGSQQHYIVYDSYVLLPSKKTYAKVIYTGYKAYPFYGFNGNESFYNHNWELQGNPEYITRMFYRQERKQLQISVNIQDTVGKSKFQWRAGWEMGYYRIAPVNIEKMNKKLKGDDVLPDVPGLYEQYTDLGLIRENEKTGGLVNSFLFGMIYDSRNRLTNPENGIFTELNLKIMPSFLSKEHFSGLSVGFIHKQYLTVVKRRLIFAYRLWLNANLGGDQPFYTRQSLATFDISEGFGGSGTIRGVLMQRIIADDFVIGNFEFRSRLVNFRFINQNWYLGAVAFMDAGTILKTVKIDMNKVLPGLRSTLFRAEDKSFHKSLGAGLKLAMNENFVLSAEFAKPFDPQDGISGLYLGLGYSF